MLVLETTASLLQSSFLGIFLIKNEIIQENHGEVQTGHPNELTQLGGHKDCPMYSSSKFRRLLGFEGLKTIAWILRLLVKLFMFRARVQGYVLKSFDLVGT